MKKIFDSWNLFSSGSGHITCRDNSCQNTVTLKNFDVEY